MISLNRIRFAGIFSNELNMPDLIMDCAFDSDNSEVSTYLNREAVSVESHDGRRNNTIRYKYSERFSPRFTFLKKGFEDFDSLELRAVLKWLTSSDTPSLLDVYYDDSNVVGFSAIGNWTQIDSYKLANSRTVAVVATFESIHPFALSDLHTITKTISTPVNTTMYRWTPTPTNGTTMPEYLLSSSGTLAVGDKLYIFTGDNTNTIQKENVSSYGVISAASNGTYTVNQIDFTMSDATAVIVQDMNNTITIEIDTDDNKPVYPRITINHGYDDIPHSVVNIPSTTTFSDILDMSDYVENTVYYNGSTYYWKTPEPVFRSDTTVPDYEDWTITEVTRAYTEEDTFENNTFYHYVDSGMYYWIDPYSFHSSENDPYLTTTSVKLTNTWTDFFNQPIVLPSTIVKNNNTTELVTLDCANKIISSNSVRRIFGDDWNLTWLPLCDGKNVITVLGNCKVTIQYREVRKIGEF